MSRECLTPSINLTGLHTVHGRHRNEENGVTEIRVNIDTLQRKRCGTPLFAAIISTAALLANWTAQ